MCSNETNYSNSNSNWITIQSGQIQNGICNNNYYGSPTRQCFQNDSNNPIGIWNSTIINPCQRNIFIYLIFINSYPFENSNNVLK